MDSPGHSHVYEEDAQRTDLHSVIEGGEEEHHEKKSVLEKVKDKAKRIKDTISKKRHGHGEEHRHGEEEDEDENEEEYIEDDVGLQDPDIHGAPMYESKAAQDFLSSPPEEGSGAKERLHLESAGAGLWEEDKGAPKAGTGEPIPGSYQTSATGSSSSGGPEPGVLRSLQALSVSDQPANEAEEKESAPPTGSHDQFSPDSSPSGVCESEEKAQPVPEEAEPERREGEEQQPHTEKNAYTEKMSAAAAAIAGKAAHAKEAAVSAAVGSAEYGKKVAETVYEKVTGAESAVASTVSQQQQQHPAKKEQEEISAAAESPSAGKAKKVLMREYLAEKLSPGEADRALCEVISDVIRKNKDEERDVREEAEEKTAAESGSGEKKASKGVVSKIKGAVTSLFGEQSHAPPSQARGRAEAMDTSRAAKEGGRRLQESSN